MGCEFNTRPRPPKRGKHTHRHTRLRTSAADARVIPAPLMMAPESITRCVSFWASGAAAGEEPQAAACFRRLRLFLPPLGTVTSSTAAVAAPASPPAGVEASETGAEASGGDDTCCSEGGNVEVMFQPGFLLPDGGFVHLWAT